MHYLSEKDIVDLVTKVIAEKNQGAEQENGMEVPVEMSGRHVHLDRATMDILFGEGAELAPKKELSQPGQYLAEERVKLVTERGTEGSDSTFRRRSGRAGGVDHRAEGRCDGEGMLYCGESACAYDAGRRGKVRRSGWRKRFRSLAG